MNQVEFYTLVGSDGSARSYPTLSTARNIRSRFTNTSNYRGYRRTRGATYTILKTVGVPSSAYPLLTTVVE